MYLDSRQRLQLTPDHIFELFCSAEVHNGQNYIRTVHTASDKKIWQDSG
jgi:hypothetical protein